jgi:hypothetical protein
MTRCLTLALLVNRQLRRPCVWPGSHTKVNDAARTLN